MGGIVDKKCVYTSQTFLQESVKGEEWLNCIKDITR